jgi:hypothetical protein
LDGLGAGVDSSVSSSCVMLMIPLLSASIGRSSSGSERSITSLSTCGVLPLPVAA